MHNIKDRHHAMRRMAVAAALTILSAWPMTTANAQVTPTAEAAIPWTDMGETVAPEQATKASQSTFATRRPTLLMPTNAADGYWTAMADGTEVWTTGLKSAGATSMSLELTNIVLPAGGEITVWGEDGQALAVDQKSGFTPIVNGEQIVLQYVGPQGATPMFSITAAFCGFKKIGHLTTAEAEDGASINKIGHGASYSCEVNASCNERADKLGRAVCRLILNNVNVGTGTLINNTKRDRAPLVLTSAHVVNKSELKNCIALFGFTEPFCDGDGYYVRGSDEITSGTLVAFDAEHDMAVIRLERAPSLACQPYWAGWDRTTETVAEPMCVHHPNGDTQKISIGDAAEPYSTYKTTDKNATDGSFIKDAFWKVGTWTSGATEGGSSGSSLVNASGHVIGALSGGEATCKRPNNDWFWMISEAWNASSDGIGTLRSVLDPDSTEVYVLDGIEGTVTTDGPTSMASSFDPRGEISYFPIKLSSDVHEVAQGVATSGAKDGAKVWAVRLYAATTSDATNLQTNAKVGVCITTSDNVLTYTAAAESVTGSNTTVDYVFASPIDLDKTSAMTIRVKVGDSYSGSGIQLKTVASTDDSGAAQTLQNGKWTDAGRAIAAQVIYTTHDTSAIIIPTDDSDGKLWIHRADGAVKIAGEAMSTIAVYDRTGRLTKVISANGATEVSVDMCGTATGLYVVRVLCESGKKKTFKILNN